MTSAFYMSDRSGDGFPIIRNCRESDFNSEFFKNYKLSIITILYLAHLLLCALLFVSFLRCYSSHALPKLIAAAQHGLYTPDTDLSSNSYLPSLPRCVYQYIDAYTCFPDARICASWQIAGSTLQVLTNKATQLTVFHLVGFSLHLPVCNYRAGPYIFKVQRVE